MTEAANRRRTNVPAEDVRAQLQAILTSEAFRNAPNLCRFLRYVVNAAVQGTADKLKEYSIGVEVFGRGESFDPRADTIVRVQARRLRAKLTAYYACEGKDDAIVISVPKGRYAPLFFLTPSRDPVNVVPEGVTGTAWTASQLPSPRTPLVGRESDLAALGALLGEAGPRLMTITGAGGSGKTRVAVECGARATASFSGGVYFVSLVAFNEKDAAAAAIAQVLGFIHHRESPVQALTEQARRSIYCPTLLILDNFEQLLGSSSLLSALLDECPPMKLLVTSRKVLRIYGEHEYPLSPLLLPDPDQLPPLQKLGENPAVKLFVDRASAVTPSFTLTEANGQSIARICCRVDGLPLAIELAAARVRMLSPEAILHRLGSPFALLTSGPVDVHDRHRTLLRTMEWSYDLLNAADQTLFRRLSVFVGGCTLEGVEAVGNARSDLERSSLEALGSLVLHNLLQPVASNCMDRFTMLETIREFGRDRLHASDEAGLVNRAHAAYFLVLAEEGNATLTEVGRNEWLNLCGIEHRNFRAALDWLVETGNAEWALRMGIALFRFWERREHLTEGSRRLQAVLSMPGVAAHPRLRARALYSTGTLLGLQGDLHGCDRWFREALDIFTALSDRSGMAGVYDAFGSGAQLRGEYASARRWFERSLQLCRESGATEEAAGILANLARAVSGDGDHGAAASMLKEAIATFVAIGNLSGAARCWNQLGDAMRAQREWAEASRCYQCGMVMFDGLSDEWGKARSLLDLGRLACEREDYAQAKSLLADALQIFLSLKHQRGIAKSLEALAALAVRQTCLVQALTLMAAATALRSTIGAPARPDEQQDIDHVKLTALRQCSPVSAEQAWNAGTSMRVGEAVQYAIR
jgi:predicted ATPase